MSLSNAYQHAISLGGDPKDCVCLNIRQASRVLTQYYDEALKTLGINITQYSLLMPLEAKGAMRISDLAKLQIIERTTLTRNLSILERTGLVKVVAGEDRRTRVVQITSKGRKTLLKAAPLWLKAQNKVVSRMGAEKWEGMHADVRGLIKGLR